MSDIFILPPYPSQVASDERQYFPSFPSTGNSSDWNQEMLLKCHWRYLCCYSCCWCCSCCCCCLVAVSSAGWYISKQQKIAVDVVSLCYLWHISLPFCLLCHQFPVPWSIWGATITPTKHFFVLKKLYFSMLLQRLRRLKRHRQRQLPSSLLQLLVGDDATQSPRDNNSYCCL